MSKRKTLKRLSKDAQIAARVPTVVKKALDRMAHKSGMSRAAYIEHLICREAERQKVKIEVEEDDESDLEAA
jgi:predicted HicB family RNase H-like nuclease